MRAETSLSATACGSCLAISIKLSNFFTPIFNAGDCPSSRPNPASLSIATACLVPAGLLKSSTSVRTCSRDSMVEIGGTRSSESKFSENPRSVRIEWEEEVAMMRRRRPWKSRLRFQTPTVTVLLPLVVYDQRGPKALGEQSLRTWAQSVSNLKTCWYSAFSRVQKRDKYRVIAPGYPRR